MAKTPQANREAQYRWKAKHPEQAREANRQWREKHREQLREYDRCYREEHKQEIETKIKEKRKTGEWKTQKRPSDPKYARSSRARLRQAIISKLGGKCLRCGFSDWRALQIDHINGGGTQERLTLASPTRYYRQILEDVETDGCRYQLLCANCNQIKRYEDQEGVGARPSQN